MSNNLPEENPSLNGITKIIYNAYLLRVWQESPGTPFRASLQEAVTGERHFFNDLQSLLIFLESQGIQPPGEKKRDGIMTA